MTEAGGVATPSPLYVAQVDEEELEALKEQLEATQKRIEELEAEQKVIIQQSERVPYDPLEELRRKAREQLKTVEKVERSG